MHAAFPSPARLSPAPTTPWWLNAYSEKYEPEDVALPPAVDVAIIGAGISGLAAALHLRRSRPELKVALLESRPGISYGATGRNGGLLWPSLNASWTTTVGTFGRAETKRIMDWELYCLKDLAAFIKSEGLEDKVRYAPFKDGAYMLWRTRDEAASELEELRLMQSEGYHTGCKLLSHRELAQRLGTNAFHSGAYQPDVARVWAARLVHEIARAASRIEPTANLTIHTNTHVHSIEEVVGTEERAPSARQVAFAPQRGMNGGDVIMAHANAPAPSFAASGLGHNATGVAAAGPTLLVRTSQGTVRAGKVLHCTNGYASSLLPDLLTSVLVPVRNQVAATTAPYPNISLDAAFYGRGGYVYFSKREDGRVVIGGFRDVVPDMEWGTTDDGCLRQEVSRELRAYLPEMFGVPPGCNANAANNYEGLYEMEWSGILGFTQDRFPLVGPIPGRPGQFISAGFSGHGMTRTFTCAKAAASMVLGQPPPREFPCSFLPSLDRLTAPAKTRSQAFRPDVAEGLRVSGRELGRQQPKHEVLIGSKL